MDLLAGVALDAAPPPPADVKASMKAYLQSSREGPEPKDAPGYPWNNEFTEFTGVKDGFSVNCGVIFI